MGESDSKIVRASNWRGDKDVTKKILGPRERISFRDFAKLGFPKNTVSELAERTGRDDRTAKRWMSKRYTGSRPAIADRVVLAEIMRRLD